MNAEPEVHPVAALFPLMSDAEFCDLRVSIRDSGLIEPIIFDGTILLDGRNRWRACQELGIEPRTKQWSELKLNIPICDWITLRNLFRRNLTDDQRSQIATDITSWEAIQAKQRQEDSQFKKDKPKPGPGRGHKTVTTDRCEPFSRDHKAEHARSTVGKVAKKAKVSLRKARKAIKIQQAIDNGKLAPDTADKIKAGTLTANQAIDLLPKEQTDSEIPLRQRVEKAIGNLLKKFTDEELPKVKEIIAKMFL
jgi:hypothetical protein